MDRMERIGKSVQEGTASAEAVGGESLIFSMS